MSLAFLGLDDEPGLCPSCSGKHDLVYDNFGKLISCEACIYLRLGYAERLKREQELESARVNKAMKDFALELGRKRLERMKQA